MRVPPSGLRYCALVPAYNVETTIGKVVEGVSKYIPDVTVVDDGSGDGTAQAAAAGGAEVLRQRFNRGKGLALKLGFRHVLNGPWDAAVTLDGDLQHDPDEIPKLLQVFENTDCDLVTGSRLQNPENIPRPRHYANLVGVRCISWAAMQPIEDSQCGFRVYSRKVLETLRLRARRFDLETEILIKAGLNGMKIASVPIRTIYHPEALEASHYRPVFDTWLICMIFLKGLAWRRGMEL